MELTPKPHQVQAVKDVLAAIEAGARRIILTSPTGGGKSFIMALLVRELFGLGKRVQIYTNRKLLVEQTEKNLIKYGIDFGVRAAGHEFQPYYPIQLSSVQTEHSRVVKKKDWMLFDSDVVFVDEGHMANNDQAQSLMRMHIERGAAVVYVTATPLDMQGMAETIITAGTNSELRQCGLLVPAIHYGAPEPDFKKFKIQTNQELTEPEVKKLFNVKHLYGHIVEWFDRLNSERRPTILFAPGVEESRWLAQHLTDAGITAAHIDGDDVWVDGQFHRSSASIRDAVLDRSKNGEITVLCNRYVLREGIDCPWIGHGIFATVFGNLSTYLQSGGRLLRADGKMSHITIQDHGGNWWRWGSLNADRKWELDISSRILQGSRDDELREKKKAEPTRCPKCGLILAGRKCTCGYAVSELRKVRPVMQADGTVMEHVGDIFVQKIRRAKPDTQKIWTNLYFRGACTRWELDGKDTSGASLMKFAREDGCKDEMTMPFGPKIAARFFRSMGTDVYQTKKGMTFAQVEALFFQENHYWPPRTLHLMPKFAYDWYRHVADVPMDRLYQPEEYQ